MQARPIFSLVAKAAALLAALTLAAAAQAVTVRYFHGNGFEIKDCRFTCSVENPPPIRSFEWLGTITVADDRSWVLDSNEWQANGFDAILAEAGWGLVSPHVRFSGATGLTLDDPEYHFGYIHAEATYFTPTVAVPEPETYALLLAGLGALGFMGRRQRAAT